MAWLEFSPETAPPACAGAAAARTTNANYGTMASTERELLNCSSTEQANGESAQADSRCSRWATQVPGRHRGWGHVARQWKGLHASDGNSSLSF